MSDDYKKQLKNLLNNLFQFDVADLDFGIYRIMNKKRDEIEQFIENDLIDAVNVELGEYSESKGANLNDEIEGIKAEIIDNLGEDALDENGNINQIYIGTPIAKKLSDRYEKACVALKNADMSDQHEGEIFSHIYQFFSRYYDNGDFMSLRRYSQKEKYAIPYNGEEVVLHWANKDQYYIKTGENFKNYSFKVGEHTVEFLIREAEGTTNNNKAEKRFFVLTSSGDNLEYDDSNKKLTIFFEYRGLSKDEEKEYGTRNVQEAILAKIKDEIASQVEDSGLKASLTKVVSVSKDKKTERTLIEKHLRTYTKKNTTDYFIHKNLKDFLVGELDFYIKNEVFHLDDLGTENELSVEQYVTRAKVMKNICLKIIDFLAQIEDFQKMLFEKKKFVVKTDYCMTLDNVPEELYSEIVKNENQINEWNTLYEIGENEQGTLASFGNGGIDVAYLKDNPFLVIDTKFFEQEFKDRILSSFDDIDDTVGGLMMNSENWQALNLMQEKYHEKVKCIYIDPPYNTDSDDFIYKDGYKSSSWISMVYDRVLLGKSFNSHDGIIFASIDDKEVCHLDWILSSIYGFDPDVYPFVWHLPRGINAGHIAKAHEYILPYFINRNETPKFNKPASANQTSIERCNKQIDARHPESEINFPSGIEFEGDSATFENEISGSERIKIISNKMIFEKGQLKEPVTLSAGWTVKNMILNWLEGKDVSDSKGQPIKRFFFKDNGKLYYEKDINTYSAKSVIKGIADTQDATSELLNLFPNGSINYPKPTDVLKYLFELASSKQSIILDYFAGSGTTAHAVLNLNKEDSGSRKYILVEMGEYFDTVTKPRIQKVMYSDNWKDGKPQSTDGISHIFKYQSLEQYEDTLNNIEFTESGTVQRTLTDMDGYFLRYMLDFETRDSSPCKFNVEKLTKPFDYTLKIAHGNELKDENVDLVETFNYLLGIHVKQIRTFNDNGTYYKFVLGKKDEDEIAIIWRNTEQLDLKADKIFIEETILGEFQPTKTYINSDFYVERALPIEPEFKKLMVV